jgi:hypothetical protein
MPRPIVILVLFKKKRHTLFLPQVITSGEAYTTIVFCGGEIIWAKTAGAFKERNLNKLATKERFFLIFFDGLFCMGIFLT